LRTGDTALPQCSAPRAPDSLLRGRTCIGPVTRCDAPPVLELAEHPLDDVPAVIRTNRSADRFLVGDIKIMNRRITSVDREATSVLDRALLRHLSKEWEIA
jgi:hypothetical protein